MKCIFKFDQSLSKVKFILKDRSVRFGRASLISQISIKNIVLLYKLFEASCIIQQRYFNILKIFFQCLYARVIMDEIIKYKSIKILRKDRRRSRWCILYICVFVCLWITDRGKLTSKISKPAISSTPIKCCLFCLVSRVSLHFFTNHLNSLSNIAFDMAPTE